VGDRIDVYRNVGGVIVVEGTATSPIHDCRSFFVVHERPPPPEGGLQTIEDVIARCESTRTYLYRVGCVAKPWTGKPVIVEHGSITPGVFRCIVLEEMDQDPTHLPGWEPLSPARAIEDEVAAAEEGWGAKG
jgi:hypothetical protein